MEISLMVQPGCQESGLSQPSSSALLSTGRLAQGCWSRWAGAHDLLAEDIAAKKIGF